MGEFAEFRERLRKKSRLAKLCSFIKRNPLNLEELAVTAIEKASLEREKGIRRLALECVYQSLEDASEWLKNPENGFGPAELGAGHNYFLKRDYEKNNDDEIIAYDGRRECARFEELLKFESGLHAGVEFRAFHSDKDISSYFENLPERLRVLEEWSGERWGWIVVIPKSWGVVKENGLTKFMRNNGYVTNLTCTYGALRAAVEKRLAVLQPAVEKPAEAQPDTPEKEMTPLPYLKPDVSYGDDVKKC